GLVDDMWALGLAGIAPIGDALELVARTPADADPNLWAEIAEHLVGLDPFYRGDLARQSRWRAYATGTLGPVLARIGWQARADETAPVTVLRSTLIETLGELDDPATIAEARRRYDGRASDAEAYPAGLRKSILAVVARHADAASWQAMRASARAEPSPVVKDGLYRYLASARDEALVRRALDLALGGESGATNAAAMVNEAADEHPDLAFDFAVAHRERMNELLGEQARNRFYPRLAMKSVDPAMAAKMRRFADAYMAPHSRRSAETAIARVRYRAAVAKERLVAVDSWLRSRGM
ncbi:MAG: ERAP1-like C-terminal domain-containing protein, partial [Pseudomonadota bacterium]|nr:ERAP1-like C-terminal domain-containing protein [Pseudomonadota bacterium]